MADAVENVLVLRGRTFAARTALASRMRVPGRSRRWENAVLGWEVRPRSDVGGVSTRTAPPESRRTRGAVCRSQARAASDARPPGRRWPADWRTEPRACCRVGSCEACETHGTCDGAVGDCVRCTSPRGNVQLLGPQLREGRAQDVSAGWHDWGASLRLLPPEHVQCPGRGGEELGRR